MAELVEIQTLMEQLGDADETIAAIYQTGAAEWAVVYDEQTIVAATFDEERERLVLSAELGRPDESRLASVYAALLNYTFLWQETGGVKMALAGDEGDAVQLYDLDVAGLTPRDLATVLNNFALKSQVWRSFVQSDQADASAPLLEPPGIRV